MPLMLCPVLVGREAELRALTGALDDATRGRGGVVFVVGDPGVGKSRLAGEAVLLASSRRLPVLTGRATEASALVPLRPIAEALIRVARTRQVPDAPEIAEYRPALASVVPEWSPEGQRDAEISPLILGEALVRLLVALGGAGTLLVLEDLQWADPETLAVLEYLADNLGRGRVLCVATLRRGEPSAAGDLVRALHARRAASVIEVPRLSERELERMAAACLGQESPLGVVVRRVLADCDGLPFAVEELLAAAVSSGRLVRGETGWQVNAEVTTGVPTSIAESVRRRLAGLGADAAEVIVSAAVLGRQFDWTLLPGLAGMTEEKVLAAVRQARDVQLIQPGCSSQADFRFRHSLTREAIVSDLLPPDLAMRSARAAAVVESARPGPEGVWCELAAELYQAAGQPVRAGTLLLEAGRRALGQGALTSAQASLRKARSVVAQAPSAEPGLLADIDDALARTLELAGDCGQLVPVAERLLAGLETTGAGPLRKALVRIRLAHALSEVSPAAAAAHLAAARTIADSSSDPALASQVDAAAARCAFDAGDLDRALDLARRSLTSAETAGLHAGAAEAACEALEVIGLLERAHDICAARAAFDRAYQIATSEGLAVRRIRALHDLGTIDAFEDANPSRLSEVMSLALESGAISTATAIELQRAGVWTLGTDLDRALAAARRCQETAARLRMRRVEAVAVSVQACALAVRAGRQAVERAAGQAEGIAPGDPEILASTWGQARVIAAIFSDDPPAALEAITTGISYARQEPLTAPFLAWGFWALLQAVFGQDGRGALREARAAGAEVTRWNRGCLAYAEAVLEGRDGRAERAAELADAGAEQFRPCAPWWNHALRRIIAPAAIHDGWGQPAAWLRQAIPDLEASGHDRLVSACRRILRQAGEPVPRRGRGNADVPGDLRTVGVTSREMDVFLLVAQGCSNAQIADRLFISPKTVETHVASLAAKTRRPGRRELVALAAARHAPEPRHHPCEP